MSLLEESKDNLSGIVNPTQTEVIHWICQCCGRASVSVIFWHGSPHCRECMESIERDAVIDSN